MVRLLRSVEAASKFFCRVSFRQTRSKHEDCRLSRNTLIAKTLELSSSSSSSLRPSPGDTNAPSRQILLPLHYWNCLPLYCNNGVERERREAHLTAVTTKPNLPSQRSLLQRESTNDRRGLFAKKNAFEFWNNPTLIQTRHILIEVESQEQYRTKLKENRDNLLVIQFSACWCGPCRQMRPIVTKWSSDMPSVDFLVVDIDEQSELAEEEDIKHVPTFVLMKHGKQQERFIGADAAKLKEAIERHSQGS